MERMQVDTASQESLHKLKDEELTADNMFPIYIQVKNWASAFGENLLTFTSTHRNVMRFKITIV